jgi:hypothetical protein
VRELLELMADLLELMGGVFAATISIGMGLLVVLYMFRCVGMFAGSN